MAVEVLKGLGKGRAPLPGGHEGLRPGEDVERVGRVHQEDHLDVGVVVV